MNLAKRLMVASVLSAVLVSSTGIFLPAEAHNRGNRVGAPGQHRDFRENRFDRRENRADNLEDRRDRREDRWDARHDGGRRDQLEDRADRREDLRDRREDRRDRAENRRDRFNGPDRGRPGFRPGRGNGPAPNGFENGVGNPN